MLDQASRHNVKLIMHAAYECEVFLTTVSEPISARHMHYVNITTPNTTCAISCVDVE